MIMGSFDALLTAANEGEAVPESGRPIANQRDPDDLADDVRVAVLKLARRIRAEKADDELSDSQYSVLAYLVREGPRTLSELSGYEQVTPPSMNRTVNHLATAGYVARKTSDEDRRKVWFSATDEGRRIVQLTRARRDSWLDEKLEELDPQARTELAAATTILRKLAES